MKLENILLASSLFYFRIPRDKWGKRMKLLKAAGYNAIDVYFPWNYHELKPGQWDFSGNRDVAAFLALAAEHELAVIARPGPYICSEWDGGGLPARLTAEGVAVRQDDPVFLAEIGAWYKQILPLLAAFQPEQGGTVMCMQIENELDFFDCKSPVSYMEKLMKMAAQNGITVPLFYCCGQNDLLRAGGLTPGLYTAFNVYSAADSGGVEERVLHLYSSVAERKMPLLITETNREHSYLKRLLACGAKLLGPYNQTAGTNMEWYNGLTNWGTKDTPLSLIAGDYDFCSMIGSAGEVNEEFYQARLLAGLINSFPRAFAKGVPSVAAEVKVESIQPVNQVVPVLQTAKGEFLAISNLGDREDAVRLSYGGSRFSLQLGPLETKLVPFNVVLSEDGELVLLGSNYEIAFLTERSGKVLLAMYGRGEFCGKVQIRGQIREVCYCPGEEKEADTAVVYEDEHLVIIAGLAASITALSIPGLTDLARPLAAQAETGVLETARLAACEWPAASLQPGITAPMEQNGQYRGIGCYQFDLPAGGDILFQEAADILTIYHADKWQETLYSRGNTIIRSLPAGEINVYTEIWGHSNFDDIRCKSLQMNSLKGIRRIVQLTYRRDLSDNWLFDVDEQPVGEWYFFRHSAYNTIMGIDSYNKAVSPLRTVYDKWVMLPAEADALYLHFSQAECTIHVYINGHYEGNVLKDDPYIDISKYAGNERIEVCLRTERRYYADPVGCVTLLGGRQLQGSYGRVPVESMVFPKAHMTTGLPLQLKPHQHYLLELPLERKAGKEMKLVFDGQDVKLTIIHDQNVVGRLVLGNDSFPEVKGGRSDVAYINDQWLETGPPLIWCQPIGTNPEIREIKVCYYQSVC